MQFGCNYLHSFSPALRKREVCFRYLISSHVTGTLHSTIHPPVGGDYNLSITITTILSIVSKITMYNIDFAVHHGQHYHTGILLQ